MTFAIWAVDIGLRFTFKRRAGKFPAGQKVVDVNDADGKLILVKVRTLAQTYIQGIPIAKC